ncbi:MAG: ABC transporter ATP-binding protein, partial [Armatimonadetes bacterium]|nr:ABC transporter ATP-binding protein [Anaerolineae bacterium]
MAHPKLHIQDISLNFGGIKALQHIDFQVHQGEILAVIGPNG